MEQIEGNKKNVAKQTEELQDLQAKGSRPSTKECCVITCKCKTHTYVCLSMSKYINIKININMRK